MSKKSFRSVPEPKLLTDDSMESFDKEGRGMHFTPDYPTSCGWPVRLPRRCWTISE